MNLTQPCVATDSMQVTLVSITVFFESSVLIYCIVIFFGLSERPKTFLPNEKPNGLIVELPPQLFGAKRTIAQPKKCHGLPTASERSMHHIVDFRLRMWLGDEDSALHEIFKTSNAAEYYYCSGVYAFFGLRYSELFNLSVGMHGVFPSSL